MFAETLPLGYIETTFQRALRTREATVGILPSSELATQEDRLSQYKKLRSLVYSVVPLISRIEANGSAILSNYQSFRPSGSHYDPVYFETFDTLENKYGLIRPGDDVYEVTSGSAGISCAWLANRLGCNAHIYVPASLPTGRKQEMINFGAILEEVGGENSYVPEASRAETRAFVKDAKNTGHLESGSLQNEDFNLYYARREDGHTMCLINHSENGITPRSMEDILAQVYSAIPDGVTIDNILSIIGNGSSSTGLYRAREKYFPQARLVGIENYDSAVLFREKYPERAKKLGLVYKPQKMFGSIIPGMKLPFVDQTMFDEIRLVDTKQMESRMRSHNSNRAVIEWIGMSSASSMIVAEGLAKENPGSVTLSIVYDGGYRYGEPVVATKEYDQTAETVNYRRMPRHAPWIQYPSKDLASMPHNIAQVYNRVSWGKS
ncbi:MAG: pyridoxal-phosphate dependent enzyme [Candidatus Daviesbacteria bacterium]|nr:pyridoxal-phosphate dependent enzyme [Candidatus Daviesbacteria bacterium]